MNMVETPISIIVVTRTFLRPSLSPMRPKYQAPRGLARKPTAYVRKATSIPTTGSKLGKKMRLKMMAAASE